MVIQQLLCHGGERKEASITERRKYLNYGRIPIDFCKRQASYHNHKWVFPYLAMHWGTQMRAPIKKATWQVAYSIYGAEGRIV